MLSHQRMKRMSPSEVVALIEADRSSPSKARLRPAATAISSPSHPILSASSASVLFSLILIFIGFLKPFFFYRSTPPNMKLVLRSRVSGMFTVLCDSRKPENTRKCA